MTDFLKIQYTFYFFSILIGIISWILKYYYKNTTEKYKVFLKEFCHDFWSITVKILKQYTVFL